MVATHRKPRPRFVRATERRKLTASLPCRLLRGLVLLHTPLHLVPALRRGNVLHPYVDLLGDNTTVNLREKSKNNKSAEHDIRHPKTMQRMPRLGVNLRGHGAPVYLRELQKQQRGARVAP